MDDHQVLIKYQRRDESSILVCVRQMVDSDNHTTSIDSILQLEEDDSKLDFFVLEVCRKQGGQKIYDVLAEYPISGRHLNETLARITPKLIECGEEKVDPSEVIAYLGETIEGFPDSYDGNMPILDGEDDTDLGLGIPDLDERLV